MGEILDRCRTRDAVVVYLFRTACSLRPPNGRIDATLSPDCCRHQYEIPFMIWMSDRYRAARPELAAAIARAVDRPYMTDDLPHLLLDLAGLSCRWFDPTRSVINDRFDASRPRLLRDDKVDYDLIMRQAKGNAETNKGCLTLVYLSDTRSIFSNHVVFGGMMLPVSAMLMSCCMETG